VISAWSLATIFSGSCLGAIGLSAPRRTSSGIAAVGVDAVVWRVAGEVWALDGIVGRADSTVAALDGEWLVSAQFDHIGACPHLEKATLANDSLGGPLGSVT
jgi:hypothetical protein